MAGLGTSFKKIIQGYDIGLPIKFHDAALLEDQDLWGKISIEMGMST
jgi:hypothetical protein